MTKILAFISIFLILNGIKQKEIIASYSAISCPCAQWKVEGENENIYLERQNGTIQDVNKLWDGESLPFKVKLKGKGVPVYKKEGQFGDLYLTYNIQIPTGLTEKQRELFEELAKLSS